MAAETAASLPYHEPPIVSILIQSSFLLLLNVVNAVLDRLVYCGLLGQVLIGIAWGTPGAQWLSTHVEEVIVQLGYLGLILLVYEGSTVSISPILPLLTFTQGVFPLLFSLSRPTSSCLLPLPSQASRRLLHFPILSKG